MTKSIRRGKRLVTAMLLLFLGGMVFLSVHLISESAFYISQSGKQTYGMVYDRNGTVLFDGKNGMSAYAGQLTDVGNLIGDTSGQMNNTLVANHLEELVNYSFTAGSLSEGDAAVFTSLDHAANRRVYDAFGGKDGCAIAYNYQTGELLVCTSLPNIDPATYQQELETLPSGSLLCKAFYGTVPGSTQKISTLIAATERLGINALRSLYFDCAGSYLNRTGGQINCHLTTGHGTQEISAAFANSCNCYFAQLIEYDSLPLSSVIASYEQMGYRINGEPRADVLIDGIRCQGATTTLTDSYDFHTQWGCIGQGETLISPCQLMMWQSAIAGGTGLATLPYLITAVQDVSGEKTSTAETAYTDPLFSAETAQAVKQVMLENGQNYTWKISGYSLGVKSGTAQVSNGEKENSLLVGFVDDPETPIAFCVLIEDRHSWEVSTEQITQVMLDSLTGR